MDLKIYKKTRYQNIYQRIKGKHFVIAIRKPKSTIISKDFNGNRIYDIEVAKKVRDTLAIQGDQYIQYSKGTFKSLWAKYIEYCEIVEKLAFNTLKKKKNFYKAHYNYFDNYKVNKITRDDIINFIENIVSPVKQKNEILKILKCFFNWCVKEEYINKSPAFKIKEIKTTKNEMKYWTPEELKKFINYLDSIDNEYSKRIKMLTLIGFTLGDRIGETRALTWSSINIEHHEITISHSINYDSNSKNYLSSTKNYQSQRTIDITDKLINEILNYKEYLKSKYKNVNDIIFYNYKNNKPYSDTALRKQFYKFIDDAKVPKIRMYDLRHTYVTIMMSENWKLYHISKQLGHKNYSTTVDKYGHIESNTRKEIAKSTDKYI